MGAAAPWRPSRSKAAAKQMARRVSGPLGESPDETNRTIGVIAATNAEATFPARSGSSSSRSRRQERQPHG